MSEDSDRPTLWLWDMERPGAELMLRRFVERRFRASPPNWDLRPGTARFVFVVASAGDPPTLHRAGALPELVDFIDELHREAHAAGIPHVDIQHHVLPDAAAAIAEFFA